MKDLTGISAALRAAFQPVPGPLPPPKSRNFEEAVERLGAEASQLTRELDSKLAKNIQRIAGDL